MSDATTSAPVRRRARRSVHVWDRAAEMFISLGGLAVLAAVLGICVYLVWMVLPLFEGGEARPRGVVAVEAAGRPSAIVIDEYRQAAAVIDESGWMTAFVLEDGRVIERRRLAPEGRALTAVAQSPQRDVVALGFDDGSVQIGTIGFSSALLGEDESEATGLDGSRVDLTAATSERPVVVKAVGAGRPALDPSGDGAGVVTRREEGDLRLTVARVELRAPATAPGAGIDRLDVSVSAEGKKFLLIMRRDGSAALAQISERRPLDGSPVRISLIVRPVETRWGETLPPWTTVTGDGQHVLSIWSDGRCERYAPADESDPRSPMVLMQEVELTNGAEVTATGMLAGGQTLLVADARGRLEGFSLARDPEARPDGHRLRHAHTYRTRGAAIRAIGASPRDRMFVAADAEGGVEVFHGTSAKRVARGRGEGSPVIAAIAPKNDGIVSVDASGDVRHWNLATGHAQASLESLFGPQVYEGAAEAEFVYQSSAASGASESKLSLVPLIFGTLKATLCALLFAAPIAVLAAAFTSEFLSPRVRRVVKPGIELMASMPSVVLGFLAAVVIAPWVATRLPAVLAVIVATPLTVVIGATAWHMLPEHVARRATGMKLVAGVAALVGLGVLLAAWGGPVAERLLFAPSVRDIAVLTGHVEPARDEAPEWVGARSTMSPDEQRRLRAQGLAFVQGRVVRAAVPAGEAYERMMDEARAQGLDRASLRRWLDGVYGGPWPGWVVVLFPPGLLAAFALRRALVDREVRARLAGASAGAASAAHLALCVGTIGLGVVIAAAGAGAISAMGMDPRDSIFGPFSPQNTLVVGIIMGFAIIPIIYTISEDALRSVPDSLRLASLGCGATPWQTTMRVVMPVAASGVFSACMIGLGRAVGETMIVLMAAGGTPQISTNLFSGFRTLAANIAIELPEAQAGSTHYRVLFLCGLVLFVMTFVINTTAEMVRIRVRRRTSAL